MTISGSSNPEIIKGTAYNDTIIGAAGADTLTGGTGNDIFVYKDPLDSTVSSFDTIMDFSSSDKLQLNQSVNFISATIKSTGNLQNDLKAALAAQTQSFIQNSAALVAITGSASDAGTYAVIANHTNLAPGFVAETDTVIKFQNYQSGALTASNFFN
jgi:hypothetical protein